MKKLLMIFTMLMVANVFAATEVVGGIEWKYEIKNGQAQLARYCIERSTAGRIDVPATLGGCPVTAVGFQAFFGCFYITEVVVPVGVREIGRGAFSSCFRLERISLPATVTAIGESAFISCKSLREIHVDGQNPTFTVINRMLCNKDGSEVVACPARVSALELPLTVKSIRSRAFSWCIAENVFIPMSVVKIGCGAFDSCVNLKSFSVDEKNGSFCVVNGLLCDKTRTRLVACPGAVLAVSFPKGIVAIEDEAFAGCENLGGIKIPSSVKRIGENAFNGCRSLSVVELHEGLITIGNGAFYSCENLTKLEIPSTVTQIGDFAFQGMSVYYFSKDPPLCSWVDGQMYDDIEPSLSYINWNEAEELWQGMPWKRWNPPSKGLGVYDGEDFDKETGSGYEDGSAEAPVEPIEGLTADFNGSAAHTFNGLVYDTNDMCGMVQVTTAKATAKGVKMSGSVVLEDGKKQTIKAVTAQVSGGYLKVSTTVGKLGTLNLTIGGNGFLGTLGDMTVATADVDESTGIMSATVKVQYFDAKTGKIKTKSYKLTGVTSNGEAVGNVSLKNDVKTFEAVIE